MSESIKKNLTSSSNTPAMNAYLKEAKIVLTDLGIIGKHLIASPYHTPWFDSSKIGYSESSTKFRVIQLLTSNIRTRAGYKVYVVFVIRGKKGMPGFYEAKLHVTEEAAEKEYHFQVERALYKGIKAAACKIDLFTPDEGNSTDPKIPGIDHNGLLIDDDKSLTPRDVALSKWFEDRGTQNRFILDVLSMYRINKSSLYNYLIHGSGIQQPKVTPQKAPEPKPTLTDAEKAVLQDYIDEEKKRTMSLTPIFQVTGVEYFGSLKINPLFAVSYSYHGDWLDVHPILKLQPGMVVKPRVGKRILVLSVTGSHCECLRQNGAVDIWNTHHLTYLYNILNERVLCGGLAGQNLYSEYIGDMEKAKEKFEKYKIVVPEMMVHIGDDVYYSGTGFIHKITSLSDFQKGIIKLSDITADVTIDKILPVKQYKKLGTLTSSVSGVSVSGVLIPAITKHNLENKLKMLVTTPDGIGTITDFDGFEYTVEYLTKRGQDEYSIDNSSVTPWVPIAATNLKQETSKSVSSKITAAYAMSQGNALSSSDYFKIDLLSFGSSKGMKLATSPNFAAKEIYDEKLEKWTIFQSMIALKEGSYAGAYSEISPGSWSKVTRKGIYPIQWKPLQDILVLMKKVLFENYEVSDADYMIAAKFWEGNI